MSILDGLTPDQVAVARGLIGAVQARNLPVRAAVIVIETGIVESGLRILANPNVPESLSIPHVGVGSDHASVGPLQQQVPMWGTAAVCMNPASSAGLFLDRLVAFDWQSMPTGTAAQTVQVSAFPDRYQVQEATALQVVAAIWPAAAAPDSGSATRLDTSEEDAMYTLFQVAPGTPCAGRIYAVRAGSLPVWLSPTALATLRRFAMLTNPSKPNVILQGEIDNLTAVIKEGAN